MSSLVYSIKVKMYERIRHPKKFILMILSLSIAFYFVVMFICKVHEVDKDILFYKNKNKVSDVIVCHFQSNADLNLTKGVIVRNSKGYLKNLNEDLIKGNLISLDFGYYDFFEMSDLSSHDWSKFFSNQNGVLVHQNIARKLGLKNGDDVFINGVQFTCMNIISQHDFKDKVVLHDSAILSVGNRNEMKSDLFITKRDFNSLPDELKRLKWESFDYELSDTIRSLNTFKLFLMGFSAIFILISLLNVYLIIYTNMNTEKRNYVIKKALGETVIGFFISCVLDVTMICFVAYHFSLLLYYLLIPSVPVFFYYRLSVESYLLCAFFILLSGIVLSMVMCLKQTKTNFDLLRY